MKYITLALVAFVLFMMFRNSVDDETLIAAHESYQNGAIIVDVRTPSEYQAKHIEGALNLPLQGLPESLQQLDKNQEVIVYCRSGNRSATAAKMLQAEGFTVYDVATQGDWERQIKAIAE